jgi:hypothetical protein
MKTRTRSLILALVVLVALVAPHAAAEGEVTVQGEVLDMACYLGHGAKGDEHAACAAKCIKAGQPMGLLASDGKVYLLVASHKDATAFEQAKGFAGKRVEIHGTSMARDGFAAVEVSSVKAL